ncbi:MAG: lytic transglycosylase domain-containing protein [Deltaproteobacteria bacterium]|nr:lytic transglycosylase domain-containing protein [Deltaproteobacteria bacterium]
MSKTMKGSVQTCSIICLVVLLGFVPALTSCGYIGFGKDSSSEDPAVSDPAACDYKASARPGFVSGGSRPVVRRANLPPPVFRRTPEVERELKTFTERKRKSIAATLQRSKTHREEMAKIFEREGVPVEMLNLAMIESGFRPDARSRAGAVGMWQFVKSTARIYGLIVNLIEDQRLDPMLSTVAAAKHLRDLYDAYQDWHLALAAYNAGTAAVDRAILSAGTRDFWQLARRGLLREETRKFVPRFIATSLVNSSLMDNNLASNGLVNDNLAENLSRRAHG